MGERCYQQTHVGLSLTKKVFVLSHSHGRDMAKIPELSSVKAIKWTTMTQFENYHKTKPNQYLVICTHEATLNS